MTMKESLNIHADIERENAVHQWLYEQGIRFPWDYEDDELTGMHEVIGEHGRCIDYRQEAYHDVHVFEDEYEERLYICD